MKKLNYILHENHERALDNPEFDKKGYNKGWTPFWRIEKELTPTGCRKCISTLAEEVEQSIKSNEKINLSILKDCYKVSLVTEQTKYPINYLFKYMLKEYNRRYGDTTEFHGKLGGYNKDRSRVLLFYENNKESAIERKKQLTQLKKDLDLTGRVIETHACQFMHKHINLDESLKSKVTEPEKFLKKLNDLKKLYNI